MFYDWIKGKKLCYKLECVCVCCGKNCFQDVYDVTVERMDVLCYVQLRNYELKCMLILLGLIRLDQIS